jgi:glycosyltransferase involved in cell wall biosynthesis
MRAAPAERQPLDVLLVTLGATAGLRIADAAFAESLRRAGARVAVAEAQRPRAVRTLMATDLLWARAAREAARGALARERPRAIVYSTTTAALLWPRPGAIRFDAPAAGNRPGRHGLWQRPLERRRLRAAPLLLPWSAGGLAEAGACGRAERAIVLPAPVAHAEGESSPAREVAAVTYAANPTKKGFDRVLAAWRRAARPGERLAVVGATGAELRAAGLTAAEPAIEVVGPLPHVELRALLRRARVFVCAPRREDYGIVQLEALAEGCQLVTAPAPGPYAALPLARALDPRLVSDDLARALRTALDDPRAGYASRAAELLAPYAPEACDATVAAELLPRLLG